MLNNNAVYINIGNYLGNVDESTYDTGSYLTFNVDQVRYYSKNYWISSDNELVVANQKNNNYMFSLEHIDSGSVVLIANKEKFSNLKINNNGILENIFDPISWESFARKVGHDNNVYEDYYLEIEKLLDSKKEELEKNIKYFNNKFVYNFFSDRYESISNDISIDDTELPSFVNFLNFKNNKDNTYKNINLSLGGLIEDNYVESVLLSTDQENIKKYFEKYSDVIMRDYGSLLISSFNKDNYRVNINNILQEQIKYITDVPFPFYADIKINNPSSKQKLFLNGILNYKKISDDILFHFQKRTEFESTEPFIVKDESLTNQTIINYDVKEWIERELTGLLNPGSAGDERIIEETDRNFKDVEYASLINYIKNTIKPTVRKYSELQTKSCYSEVVLYKIEKRLFKGDNQPLQEFWFQPNNIDYLRLIDTQISYEKEYHYDIFAYTFVVGNQYSYQLYDYTSSELERLQDINNGIYKLQVKNSPTYKILKIPLAYLQGAVHEYPLTKPQIKIDNEENNIVFNILQSKSESLENFKIVENNDFTIFDKIRNSQQNSEQDKIKSINTSDTRKTVEIYKTMVKPISSISFQGKKYKTIVLDNQTFIKDEILTNIKYYYMFRFLNNHNTPSNISNIYEIELKEEDGYIYLQTQEVDLEQKLEKNIYKNFKRYLLIRPSIVQTQVNSRVIVNSIEDVNLGPNKESMWGKDFIVRITSKNSNRVLEFNLKSIINRKKE